jgi:hypothetical protein
MKLKSLILCVALTASAVFLSGCGGGGGDDYYDEDTPFSVSAFVDDRPVAGSVTATATQTLDVTAGESFELTTTDQVDWTVLIGGQPIEGSGNTILYGGVTIQEVFRSSTRYAADTSSRSSFVGPVTLTLIARSRFNPQQSVTINVRIGN